MRKKFFRILTATWLLVFCALSANVNATDYYWVGQGADNQWGTLKNWATISGGSSETHGVIVPPTAMDDVFFDANSFTSSAKTVTISGNRSCNNISFSGCPAATYFNLAANSELHVYGSMTLQAGMLTTGTSTNAVIYFESTNAAETLNTEGVQMYQSMNFRGTAQWTNIGDLLLRNNASAYGHLTYSIPGKNLTINGNLTSYNVAISGGGDLNINGNATLYSLNQTAGSTTITGDYTATNAATFSGGGNFTANNILGGTAFGFSGGGDMTVINNITLTSSLSFSGNGNFNANDITGYSITFAGNGNFNANDISLSYYITSNGGGNFTANDITAVSYINISNSGNFTVNSILKASSYIYVAAGSSNMTVNTRIVSCLAFHFLGTGNLTIGYPGQTGEALRAEGANNNSISTSPYGAIKLYSTGTSKIYGDVISAYSTLTTSYYSDVHIGNGTVDIYGNLTVVMRTGSASTTYNSTYSGRVVGGAIATIHGDISGAGYFRIEGATTELNVLGDFEMAFLDIQSGAVNLYGALTGNYYYNSATASVTIAGSGIFNNLGGKDINLLGGFNATGATAQVTGLGGIKVECNFWTYNGTSITALTGTNAPALIRVHRVSFTARATDIYNNVECYGDDSSASTHVVNTGIFNKITISGGNSSFATTANITTDSLVINSRKTHTFQSTSGRITTVNELLQIRPLTCGGAINVQNGTIAMAPTAAADVEYVQLTSQTITGNTPYLAANSIDNGGNNGWLITAPMSYTHYWVGGTGDWNDPDHWANATGGTPGSACVPTIYDDVVFDQNSGSGNWTVSLQSNSYCHNMTWTNIVGTASFEYGPNIQNELHIYGSLNILSTNIKWNLYSVYFMSSAPNETVTTSGVTLNTYTYFASKSNSCATTFTLMDNFNTVYIHLTGGNLNTNGQNVTALYFVSNSGNRCLNIAGSTITLTLGWNYTGAGGAPLTAPLSAGSLIKITSAGNYNAATVAHEFLAKAGDIYYNLEFTPTVYLYYGTASSYRNTTKFIQNGIFNKITLYGVNANYMSATESYGEYNYATNLRFEETDSLLLMGNLGITYEVGADIQINKYFGNIQDCGLASYLRGASGAANVVQPQLTAAPYNSITMGAGAVVQLNNLDIQTVNITGPAAPYTISNSDVLSGTGWNQLGGGAQTLYWIGGTGNWNDVTKWATASGGSINPCRPPKYPDNVIFDDNSFTAANQRVTVDKNSSCDSMTWTGAILSSLTPELYLNGTGTVLNTTRRDLDIYGSLTLAQNMKVTGVTNATYNYINLISTKANETLKTNGVRIDQIHFHFTGTTANWDIPDGFYGSGTVANYAYRTSLYFDGAAAAKYNVGGPLTVDYYVYFTGGTLDLSETTDTITIGFFSSTSGTRNLIINNAVINVFYKYSTTANSWAYSGAGATLTEPDSENSVINIRSNSTGASTFTAAADNVYNDVNFVAISSGAKTLTGNGATFRDITFYGTGTSTVTPGANATIRDITIISNSTFTASLANAANITIRDITNNGSGATNIQNIGANTIINDITSNTGLLSITGASATNAAIRDVTANAAASISSAATTSFRNVTVKGICNVISLGNYNKIRFENHANIIDRINTDTLWFYNSTPATAFSYKFTSSQTSTINKAWFAAGTNCNPSVISSTLSGTRGTVSVDIAAANLAYDPLDADTLYLDYISIQDIEAAVGSDRALLHKGNQSVDLGNNLNWIMDPYVGSAGFLGLGPDKVLNCNSIPYTLSTVYFQPNPASTFEWRKGSSSGPIIGTNSTYVLNSTSEVDTYYVNVFYYGTGSCMNSGSIHITAMGDPDPLTWTGAVSSDWNNAANWKITATGVTPIYPPDNCTDVIIPAGVTTYPNLADQYTDYVTDEDFETATCNTIHFEYGGVVARTDSLHYKRASVELNLKAFPWHTLSAPLRDMYSGDYSFDHANPQAQMRLFNSPSPQTGAPAPTADWSQPFNTDTVRLTATMGYIARVGKVVYHEDAFYTDPDDGLIANPSPTQYHLINDTTWNFPKSNTLFPYYGMWNLERLEALDQYLPSNGRQYNSRFTYESNANPSISPITGNRILAEHAVSSGYEGELVLLGNPFMAYLDFEKFWMENCALTTGGYYMIWEDAVVTFSAMIAGCNTPFLPGSDIGSRYIPPMSSFIIQTRSWYLPYTFKFTDDMSVLLPSQLKHAPSSEFNGTIVISASRGDYKGEAYVQILPEYANNGFVEGEDAQALMQDNLNNQMINIFTEVDGLYINANRLKDLTDTVRIGIITTGAGTTTLSINNTPPEYMCYFEDKLLGAVLPITDKNFTYDFNEQGNQLGRFIIYASKAPSGFNNPDFNGGDVTAFIYKKELNVVSKDGSDIQKVEILDVTGRLLYQKDNINSEYWQYPTKTLNDMLLIRTYTQKGSYVHKVINF